MDAALLLPLVADVALQLHRPVADVLLQFLPDAVAELQRYPPDAAVVVLPTADVVADALLL